MQNEGIKRVREARQSKHRRQKMWATVRTLFAGIMDILFVMAVGCWIGIGFGIGVMLALTWI